jgi:hypothetical protein
LRASSAGVRFEEELPPLGAAEEEVEEDEAFGCGVESSALPGSFPSASSASPLLPASLLLLEVALSVRDCLGEACRDRGRPRNGCAGIFFFDSDGDDGDGGIVKAYVAGAPRALRASRDRGGKETTCDRELLEEEGEEDASASAAGDAAESRASIGVFFRREWATSERRFFSIFFARRREQTSAPLFFLPSLAPSLAIPMRRAAILARLARSAEAALAGEASSNSR